MNPKRKGKWIAAWWLLPWVALSLSGCMSAYKQSVGGDTVRSFGRIYLTDFNTAWQASLDSVKSFRLDISNREGGYIQTRWKDNTAEKNFIDSFGSADVYLKAQYRLRMTVAKGFYNGRPSVKITVRKEQMIQRDVLDGWRPIETDEIGEKTLLYRVGRLIQIRGQFARSEREKAEKEMKDITF